MSLRSALAQAAAVLLLVAGCAKRPPTHFYILELRAAAAESQDRSAAAAAPGLDIGVRIFQVEPPYDEDNIVYRIGESSLEIGFYTYHRWAAPLSRMLPGVIADGLAGAEGVRTIEPVLAGREYSAYLEGRLRSLEEIDQPSQQLVRIVADLRLVTADGSEIWSHALQAEGTTQTDEVAAIVQKMNSVLSESIALARPKLVEALAQTQLH